MKTSPWIPFVTSTRKRCALRASHELRGAGRVLASVVWLVLLATPGKFSHVNVPFQNAICVVFLGDHSALAAEPADRPDIEWFKKELRISPKYLERREGILGLSWAHFLAMVFLTVFVAVALVAVAIRHRRTKELLALLLEEKKE